MLTLKNIKDKAIAAEIMSGVKSELDALDVFLASQINDFEPEVQPLVSYCLEHQGKRIRPMLVFYSGYAGRNFEGRVKAAAIMELVHQATLVHDDILDGAEMRHNTPTASHKMGAHAAVLLGDALFAHALKLASDYPTADVCRAVSLATRKVCEGEIAQTFQRGDAAITLDSYYRHIDLKTAELFRVSCELGASLSKYPAEFAKAAASFGRHLGIAYQIFDDIADLAGSEDRIGKTLGTDLESGKYTLPLLLLREAEGPDALDAALRNPEILMKRLWEKNYLHASQDRFHDEVNSALKAIEPFKELPPVEHLNKLAGFVRTQIDKLKIR